VIPFGSAWIFLFSISSMDACACPMEVPFDTHHCRWMYPHQQWIVPQKGTILLIGRSTEHCSIHSVAESFSVRNRT
jgi:hypothetical protein